MGMKQVLRKILPEVVYHSLKIQRDRRRLRGISRRDCDTSALRTRREVDLSDVFESPALGERWRDLSARVASNGLSETAGGVNPGDRRAISYLIGALKPEFVLEVGTHIGASTIHIAAALDANQAFGGPQDPKLVTVDIADVNDPVERPWLKYGSAHSPRELVAKLKLESLVEFVAQPSTEFMSDSTTKFDLIFLDGSHAAEMVYQEVPLALGALRDGGVILLHDYFPGLLPLWPNRSVIAGPYLAIERLKQEGADLDVVPLGDLPWPTKLGTNRTSLALLLRS